MMVYQCSVCDYIYHKEEGISITIMEIVLNTFLKNGGALNVALQSSVSFVHRKMERIKPVINYRKVLLLLFFQILILFSCQSQNIIDLLADIKLPSGFEISIYADNLPGARSMTQADDGIIFIGTRSQGVVYALIDKNKDYIVDEKLITVKDLNNPNGVEYLNGHLYVAEIHRIIVFKDIIKHLRNPLVTYST